MNTNSKTTNQISRSQITLTAHTLRSLGLNFGLTGTRLINKVVQILTIKDYRLSKTLFLVFSLLIVNLVLFLYSYLLYHLYPSLSTKEL